VDKYPNFEALRQSEKVGSDFEITAVQRLGAKAIVIAPHGGGIEPLTSEIAREIAGESLSYYSFQGKKAKNNRDLHITSHRFDEPRGVELVQAHNWVVAIHGCKGDQPRVLLGGRDKALLNEIAQELANRGVPCETQGHDFPGMEPMNICNRGSAGLGVQVELTMPFRKGEKVKDLITAIKRVLESQTKRSTAESSGR
jgi:phage replication-related protein YjqB (UPF0714/DUF867 family)